MNATDADVSLLTDVERVEICAAQAQIQKRNAPASVEWQRASAIINRVWRPMTRAEVASLSPEAREWLGRRGATP